MNKKDIEYYTFQYTIPVYKIKPPQKFNEYYQIHKDEIIVELDKENKRLQQKVNQLETNRDEAIVALKRIMYGFSIKGASDVVKILERGKE